MRYAIRPAAAPAHTTAAMGGSVITLNGHASGARRKIDSLVATGSVRRAHVYAPTAMKPACPRENNPVKPKIRFMLTARIALMPARLSMRRL
ncbi:MAG: hypothetical protein BWY85_01700 [Firmicutes bacterium ADurb.Bin506]|nr:MAG: hypothetical protein BWY85_01700 [Firmicutes bacterium ADurb.Bin506]